jgi:hypothetical protein
MATPDTDTSVVNQAAANENDASGVASVSHADTPDDIQSSTESLTLFNVTDSEEYKSVIESLSRGSGVAPWVTGAWDRNRMYRISQGIDYKLMTALNRRAGIYSPQQLAAIRSIRGAENYPLLIDKLCRAGKAEVSDAFGSVDRPEKLVISGLVKLTRQERRALVEKVKAEYIKQSVAKGAPMTTEDVLDLAAAMEDEAVAESTRKAQSAAHNMEDLVYGQMEEGGWEAAFDKCVDDALTLKMGVIYGPYASVTNRAKFRRNPNGKMVAENTQKYGWKWDWRSPFDMFPAGGVRGWDEGDLVDRIRLEPAQLLMMKAVPGWIASAIDATVQSFCEQGFAYFTSFDSARAYAEERGNLVHRQYGFIECLRFFGHIRGDRLMATGVPGDNRKVLSNNFYEIHAIVCANRVLFLSVMDPRIDFRGYVSASFAPDVGGLWGKGFGELAASEDSTNAAAARGEVDNAGFCTRPISTRVPEILVGGQALGPTYPGQVFISSAKLGDTRKPVTFDNIDCNLKEFQSLRTEASKEAYEIAGLPYPDMGTERAAGAGRTSSGFAEIVARMLKPMQEFIYRLERDVRRPNVKRLVLLNNAYHDDDRVKTEADIEPQGLFAELSRLANAGRKLELYDRVKSDPIVSSRRRATLLRSIAQDQGLPDSIAPSDREAAEVDAKIKEQEQAAQQAQQAQQGQTAGEQQPQGGQPMMAAAQPQGAANAT